MKMKTLTAPDGHDSAPFLRIGSLIQSVWF